MKFFDKIAKIFKKEKKSAEIMNYAGTGISYGGYFGYGSGSKYASGMSRPAPITIHDHYAVRQQARDAMYDSTLAKAMVDRYADTTVDTGMKLKPVPIASILGISDENAETWAEDVAQRFHLWAKSKKSHRSRINNFYQNQRLYQIFMHRDNDIFTRLYYGKQKDLINPLQIDFIDPNQIRGCSYTSTYMQFNYEDGIVRDDAGMETGYKFWLLNKDSMTCEEKEIPAFGIKSNRTMMLHGFNPDYAGQGRGMSRLAPVLQEFENLTDFKLSTIKKAIAQSTLTMAVENELQDSSNPLEGRVAGPVREYGSLPQPAVTAQNITPDALEPVMNYTALNEATFNEPGAVGVFNLKRGDKLKYLQDTGPSASFDSFVNSFCSYISASEGMPIEVLLMKFNQNYSASRGALILFWRIAQIWREEQIADFCNPIYEMWLSEEIAAGRISAPGFFDKYLREAWLNCEWAGAPMPNIDPLKTAEADQKYVEMCAQTLDDVARNFNGSSGKANRIKNKRQFVEIPESPFFKQAKTETKDLTEEEQNAKSNIG